MNEQSNGEAAATQTHSSPAATPINLKIEPAKYTIASAFRKKSSEDESKN